MGNVCAGLHFLCMCAKPTFNFLTDCQDETRVAAKFNYKCRSGFAVSEVSRFCEVKQPLWHQVSHPTTTQSQRTKKKTRINLPRRRADAKRCVASLLKSRIEESERRMWCFLAVEMRKQQSYSESLCVSEDVSVFLSVLTSIHPTGALLSLCACSFSACSLGGRNLSERLSTSQTLPWAHITWQGWNTHTQSHDLSTTALLFQVTGAAGHDTTPCLVPCPAGLRQTHTDDRTSTYTASMTSGFTWHPPDSIHTGTQKKNTLCLYKELNSH